LDKVFAAGGSAVEQDSFSGPGDAGIRVRGARRTFGAFAAIDRVDLDAPPGAVTALVGPSGAGKTTLLMMLATLLRPDSGEIRVAGHDPFRSPGQVRARMGWMPDSLGAYERLTTREVLEFAAAAYRFSPADRAARAAELLARVRLSEYADRPVQVLSRGQKQRLGLARAIVHRPAVVLVDEPTAGLDAPNRGELARLLRELATDGAAVLITARTSADVAGIADRVVLMSAGRTLSPQPAAEVADPTAERPERPWRIRALDTGLLLGALNAYGMHHCASEVTGVQILLRGDDDAADLIAALVRDGVRVTELEPIRSGSPLLPSPHPGGVEAHRGG
jgi:ABC-2 type transport system ATP-binding protein